MNEALSPSSRNAVQALVARAPAHIHAISPYVPGRPIDEVAQEIGLEPSQIIKLASNENPLGVSPRVRAALIAAANQVERYPDGSGRQLKAALAHRLRCDAAQIVLGNGSNELLELTARTFLSAGESTVYAQYAFSVYKLATQAMGGRGIEVPALGSGPNRYGHDLTAMRAAIRPDTRIVFVSNPTNPTGNWLPPAELEHFLQTVPVNCLVVLDEAYTEFLRPEQHIDLPAWLARHPNLIVCRTFSKAYGMAGLRLGYALCAPQLVGLIDRVRQPFNVNSLAQAAALAALDDTDYLAQVIANNTAGLQQLGRAFERLGIDYLPSYGNFITFHVPDGAALNQHLLRRGIILRPLASYGLPNSLRITIGRPEENARVIAELSAALAHGQG